MIIMPKYRNVVVFPQSTGEWPRHLTTMIATFKRKCCISISTAAWTDLRGLISRSPGTCDQRLTHTMPCYFWRITNIHVLI